MSVVESKVYVEYRSGSYWIANSRISLDSVVYAFRKGLSPESIVQSFPLLTLEQVYGAIAFYLAHRPTIDLYILEEEYAFDAMPQPLQTDQPILYRKLMSFKAQQENLGSEHSLPS
uniref:DUF433 domain-containing protein n=1 Tax=Desertifilum tharense IPPAS B-1220 TaxID=1781255 RepID=A0ACD5GQN9_9CYAN